MRTAPLSPAALAAVVLLAASPAFSAPPPAAAPAAPPAPTGDIQVPFDQTMTTVLPDGVVVTFEAGTTGRWAAAGKLSSETAKWTRGFHLELTDGEVDITMPSAASGEHAFLVTSKGGTLTDWRGRMHVAARADTTAVVVYDGAVVVGSNKQSFRAGDGTAVVLHKDGGADKSQAFPAVPTWEGGGSGPPSFAVVPEGAPATLGLAWAPAAGAKSYRVQVATDPGMTQIVRRAAVGDPSFSLAAPTAGVHFWAQVRAVGAEGLIGAWSAPRALRAVHFRLPSGGFVARDGVVVLPDGATLPLADAEGLEVAYENVRPGTPPVAPILYWAKLGGPLRPADDAPLRVAHLRDPALGVETRVTIAHRQLRADVELLPKQAHARDPIDVRAVVSDPSGRVDVSAENVTLQAMADLDPVAVAWQHTTVDGRGVWTGRIAPRRDTGPSVVRVVVKDGLGQEIGRGFLEMVR
ncbi:MAG: hypothetical protein ABSE49_17935 [Polyangiaceae bacterium]|jgi:hypothetical protein